MKILFYLKIYHNCGRNVRVRASNLVEIVLNKLWYSWKSNDAIRYSPLGLRIKKVKSLTAAPLPSDEKCRQSYKLIAIALKTI